MASKLYECKTCSKQYDRSWNRDRHESKCKIKVADYPCKNVWCSAKFTKKFNYDRHLQTCNRHTEPGNKAVCFLCKHDFKYASRLRRHLPAHRNLNYKYGNKHKLLRCDKCFVRYKTALLLQQHMCIEYPSMASLDLAAFVQGIINNLNYNNLLQAILLVWGTRKVLRRWGSLIFEDIL